MRRKFTAAEKQRFLAELKASGETPWRFAQRVGITPGTLYRWMGQQPTSTTPRFARLVTERRARSVTAMAAGRVLIQVGEARVQVEPGFDAVLLRAVVAALSGKAES